MALALFGATALGLQHKEIITTLLGKPRNVVVINLSFSALQTLTAALSLIYFGELTFRSKNVLLKGHWRDLGLWATKLGFIVLSAHVLAYRCQQECDPSLFQAFEQHFYRVQWYIRLFAAAAATSSIAVAALLGTWSLLVSDTQDPAQHPSKLLGAVSDSIAEAAGLKEIMLRMRSSMAAVLVGSINGVVCPLVLVYVLWALWLPQLPLLQRFYLRVRATTSPGQEI